MSDVWIVCEPSAWAAVAPAEGATVEPWHYHYSQAATGFWEPAGTREVYNLNAPPDAVNQIVAILDAHTAGAVSAVYAWTQGPGLDEDPDGAWPTDPAPILALMRAHPVFDQDGNQTGTEPATYDRPNWGHVFLGQGERIFAGDFSTDFSEDFR